MSKRSLQRLSASLLALALLCSCDSGDPLEKARLLQDTRGDQNAALEVLRPLLEERPDDPEVLFRYGAALLATGQPSLALWPLQRAAEDPAWLDRAGIAVASAALAAGAYDQAIETLNAEVERDPDRIEARLLRAHAHIQSRRGYEQALADAEHVLELDPERRDALVPRAVALLALERVDEAEKALEEIESLHRDDVLGLHGSPDYCAAQAKFAEERGEVEGAEQRYDACLEKFPAYGALLDDAVAFYSRQQRDERVVEILRAALDTMPGSRRYRLALSGYLGRIGRQDEAEQVLREGTEHADPMVAAEAWAALASFQMHAEDYEQAVEAYARARQLAGPADPELLFAHADALVIAGRLDEAMALSHAMADVHRALVQGRVALARHQPAQALAHFDEGIRLWPNNAVARYYAAAAAEQAGDFERAVEDYRYAMRIDPVATDAYLRLARLHDAADREGLALAALRFRAGGRPSELEAALLETRIIARRGPTQRAVEVTIQRMPDPALWGAAMAAVAEGVREREGSAAAAAVIRAAVSLDLDDPAHALALESLVLNLADSGQANAALARVDEALRAAPEAAVFHALRGHALQREKAGEAKARAAFERALELDPEQPIALRGLAEIEAAAGQREQALTLYRRAFASDEASSESGRGVATQLAALGRGEEAEAVLEELLRDRPYDVEATLELAELRVARGALGRRTRELVRRARYFGGGPAADRLVERLRAGSAGDTGSPGEPVTAEAEAG